MPKTSNTTISGKRQLSADEYRVLADWRENQDIEDKWTSRRRKAKNLVGTPERRWTTDAHVKTAGKNEAAARARSTLADNHPGRDQLWERHRQVMVRARNRRRRLPWYAAAGALATGLAGNGMAHLFALTGATVPDHTLGAIFGGMPAVAGIGIVARAERRYAHRLKYADNYRQYQDGQTVEPTHRRWLPEAALGGTAAAGLAYWITTCGLTWLAFLVALVVTCVLGARWWNASHNRLGPGVSPLEPPRPEQPTRQASASPVSTERDEYATAWRTNLDPMFGRLTGRTELDNAVQYIAELQRGKATYLTLQRARDAITSALGLDLQQVFTEPPPKDEYGNRPAHKAKVTIVTRDAGADQRYWTGPQVQLTEDGTAAVLRGLARYRDGLNEARIAMWTRDGMVSLAIFGSTGGGKSAAANLLACGALSTGLLNSIYVDFKGNSSAALRSRARIVIVGTDAVKDVQRLMKLLMDVRVQNDQRDKLFPTRERPGWFALFDEITKGIKGNVKFAQQMENMATIVRSLGIWVVSTTQDMHSSAWGGTNTRAAFAKQAVTFYMNTDSDDLVNGLTYKPSQLPTHDDEDADVALGQEGHPVAGWAVHANTFRANVPARWDWLPGDDDPVTEEPPYRASAAFDEFFNEPGIAQDEYDALVAALGEPNPDGRWIIGIGGTHHFRDEGEDVAAFTEARPVRTGGFGTPRASTSSEPHTTGSSGDTDAMPDRDRRVYELIQGGNTRTSDIEAASVASRPTVHRALDSLVSQGWIHRPRAGEYATGPASDSAESDQD